MCGIVAIFGSSEAPSTTRKLIVEMAKKLRHRGPDWSGVKMIQNGAIAHERLAIVDPESGEQPLCCSLDASNELTLAVNGEIYNHLELRNRLQVEYTFKTKSDCECILPLYLQHGHAGLQTALNQLKGMFGFVLHDSRDNSFIAVRDYMGIIPLYIGWGADGCVVVASELKAIANQCVRFQAFPPGHLYSSTTNSFVEWYAPAWYDEDLIPTQDLSLERLRTEFTDSVRRRMMSDVPWGVLLSGGLDSSLVASVAVRLLKENAAVCNPASGAPNNFGDRYVFGLDLLVLFFFFSDSSLFFFFSDSSLPFFPFQNSFVLHWFGRESRFSGG